MMSPVSLRLAALMICASSAISAHAKPWQQTPAHWVGQTIYLPNCPPSDCTYDCLSDSLRPCAVATPTR
jgi:hypothetical protein